MGIREISRAEFDTFSQKFMLSSMYQSIEYGNTMANQKYQTLFVGMINDTEDVVAASLILIEKLGQFKYAYAPRGFLIDYTNFALLEEFTNHIKKFLKKRNVMAVKICPLIAKTKYIPKSKTSLANPSYDRIFDNLKKLKYYHLGYNNFFEALKPRFVAFTPLNSNTPQMFAELDDNIKEKIKSCDIAGIRIYKGNESNLKFLIEQMREKNDTSESYATDLYNNFKIKNNADIYFAELETKTFLINTQVEYQKQINICNSFTDQVFQNQGNASSDLIRRKITEDNKLAALKNQLVYATNLLRDHPDGIIIASAMIIKHLGQAYLTLDGFDPAYQHLCGRYLLVWKIMESLALEGFRELNLGGITNPTYDGENKFKTVNDFKLSFNSHAIEYAGDFELITSYPLYTLYRNSSPLRHNTKK